MVIGEIFGKEFSGIIAAISPTCKNISQVIEDYNNENNKNDENKEES
jgi:hypothetical protein